MLLIMTSQDVHIVVQVVMPDKVLPAHLFDSLFCSTYTNQRIIQ